MVDYPKITMEFNETERQKLDPDPILLSLSHFDILRGRGENVLCVGDSPNDAMAARATNISIILIVLDVLNTPRLYIVVNSL